MGLNIARIQAHILNYNNITPKSGFYMKFSRFNQVTTFVIAVESDKDF